MKFYLDRTNETVSFVDIIGTNAKLSKEVANFGEFDAAPIRIVGLTLAPATQSGYNACAHSTPACRAACVLWFAGRRVMMESRQSAIARTKLWMLDRPAFLRALEKALKRVRNQAIKAGEKVWFRFNTASDIRVHRMPEVMELILSYVDGMYDYTAEEARIQQMLRGDWSYINKYFLTFSVKEDTPASSIRSVLDNGGNVAMVVDTVYKPQQKEYGVLPASVSFAGSKKQYRVVDGDVHDLRTPHTDGHGAVVMLRLKGTNEAKQLAREYGFAKAIPALGVDSQFTIGESHVRLCL